MAVITALYILFNKKVVYFIAFLQKGQRRIMKENNGFKTGFFRLFNAGPDSSDLSHKNLFVGIAFGIEEPSPAARYGDIALNISVVMKNVE